MRRTNKFFSEHQITGFIDQICSALAYLDGINIIHHDLKPENIFFYGD
jgi:serine/threonine protein kinase